MYYFVFLIKRLLLITLSRKKITKMENVLQSMESRLIENFKTIFKEEH